ncbi:MAG: hypothetical protein EXR99_08690 [Gemmataceae bacterium]|nr:hypothetical protein [Gemmataceae bacterium]
MPPWESLCAIWHGGGPPDPPAVEGIPCTLAGSLVGGVRQGKSFTAVLTAPLGSGLRDGHPEGTPVTLQAPYPMGVLYRVVFLERDRSRGASHFFRAFLVQLSKTN